jgi:LPXTG-motif cell wall-anchored protein
VTGAGSPYLLLAGVGVLLGGVALVLGSRLRGRGEPPMS